MADTAGLQRDREDEDEDEDEDNHEDEAEPPNQQANVKASSKRDREAEAAEPPKKQANDVKAGEEVEAEREKDLLANAEAFIAALMTTDEEFLDESPDIGYLRDIPLMASGVKKTIVLTQEIKSFWETCFALSGSYRVCAVGSPGTGKSTTMMYLIRILLQNGKKVVYLNRTEEKESYYFVWEEDEEGNIVTSIFPESMKVTQVIGAARGDKVGDTYYLCDPGVTKDSCNPAFFLEASVIINASGDDRHWGGKEFTKQKEDDGFQRGKKLIFPMTKKQKLVDACKLFSASATREQVEQRHRLFGSVPRHLFIEEEGVAELLETQKTDLAQLTTDMTKRIVNNTAELNGNNKHAPPASLMAITSDPPDFEFKKASYISDLVSEEVAKRHMKDLWTEISASDNSPTRSLLFEAYLRSLLTAQEQDFQTRTACGRSSKGYKAFFHEKLGGCTAIERTENMMEACKNGSDKVIYYSYNESEPLVDAMYKVGKRYYAIQVTIQVDHDCADQKLEAFLVDLELQADEELYLVYTVPEANFQRFVTSPASPEIPAETVGEVFIMHTEIKRPTN